MNRKNVFIVVKLICVCFMAVASGGCGKGGGQEAADGSAVAGADEASVTAAGIPKTGAFRVGSVVSDAYAGKDEDFSDDGLEASQIKAVGFLYDYDSLTYELVWSDEFDYEGLPDDTKWGYDIGGSGWGNNELQYYTKDMNAYVSEGLLTIEARKEDYNNKKYTSARLVTKNKADFLYGRFEVRAKLPKGRGTWPAIWMLPTDKAYGEWPNSGEIDIMEHVGYDQDKIHATVHTKSYYHKIGTQKSGTKVVEGVSEDFHVYAVEWLPDKIMAYIDDELIFTFEPSKYKEKPSFKEWPFDQRMHLLINIAVGGDWGGAKGIDEDIFPQEMVIDYVRVYQSPEINELIQDK